MSILEAVAAAPAGLSLTSLARAVSLPSPTVSRLVHTLERLRLLARLPDSREIVLGMGVVELGAGRVVGRELRSLARPYVEQLAGKLGEAVELAQVVDDRANYLADALDVLLRIESTHVVRAAFSSQGTIPVHATSVGKILLAHRRPSELDKLLKNPLPALASGTITDPDQLRRELAEVRSTGIAFGANEVEDGAAGLAVGIHDHRGDLIAILHVEGPATRFTRTRMQEIGELSSEVAHLIEGEFAHDLQEGGRLA